MVKPIADTGSKFPILYYRRPPVDEPYAYDPYAGTMDSHYGLGRLGNVYHPLDPFRKFPPPPPNHWGRILYIGMGALGSFALSLTANRVAKRPKFASVYALAFFTIAGGYVGEFAWKRSRYNAAVRDAHYQRYIELHPEDFPPIERHKYRDTLMKWRPCRGF